MSQLQTAQEHWGADLPDWVERLALECEKSSQNRIAVQLRLSSAVVSQTLRRKYPGDMAKVEEAVRAILMAQEVTCPALGQIPAATCLQWRAKAEDFKPTNSHRSQMYRACHQCPRFTGETANDAT